MKNLIEKIKFSGGILALVLFIHIVLGPFTTVPNYWKWIAIEAAALFVWILIYKILAYLSKYQG